MTDSSRPNGSPTMLLNLREASEIIHRDRTSLHDDVRLGKLRAVRVGRMWLVTEQDLLEFDDMPRVGRDLPRGPKSKLRDPQVAATLERLLELGMSVVGAMKAVGVAQPRYYREDRTNPGFRARMEAARARAAAKRANQLAEASAPQMPMGDQLSAQPTTMHGIKATTEATAYEARMTVELAVQESARAFRQAAQDYPKGIRRNEAYAAQARTFLTCLETLGALDNDELRVLVRQARKNIARVEIAQGQRHGSRDRVIQVPASSWNQGAAKK